MWWSNSRIRVTNILKGITEKSDGNMRIAIEAGAMNRQSYLSKNNLLIGDLVSAKLAHGNKVMVVTKEDVGEAKDGCDGLVTNVPNKITAGHCD